MLPSDNSRSETVPYAVKVKCILLSKGQYFSYLVLSEANVLRTCEYYYYYYYYCYYYLLLLLRHDLCLMCSKHMA